MLFGSSSIEQFLHSIADDLPSVIARPAAHAAAIAASFVEAIESISPVPRHADGRLQPISNGAIELSPEHMVLL